jgi:hypothetical protein
MKKIICYSFCLLALALLAGCKKGNYPGGQVAPYIAIYDIKNMYKGKDVTLNLNNMFGSNTIAALVVSDHSGGNLPAGFLVVQDERRLSFLRGITLPIGAAAANFVPGDSVHINIEGKVLTRVNGIMQITGVTEADIKKVASGRTIPIKEVTTADMIARPDVFESTLMLVLESGFNPLPAPTDVLSGDKTMNDGYGEITLHTEATASFAGTPASVNANYYGIAFNKLIGDSLAPVFRCRTANDITPLSSVIEIPPIIISGFMSDVVLVPVGNTDANYEYMQFKATKDIDFAVTPYSVVTTNNANASTPTGYPANGWATGDIRTYKFNLTTGTVKKDSFFYVGGTAKLINGVSSTSISNAKWITAYNYSTSSGQGFGTKTTNLLANSGNAFGIAVFEGTTVTVSSRPVDVIFITGGGSLFTPGPPALGYRITNTDLYRVKHPRTLEDQPFYRQGSNTKFFPYNTADQGYFNVLGGEYNLALGRWTKVRNQVPVLLTKSSTLQEIEAPAGVAVTTLKQ